MSPIKEMLDNLIKTRQSDIEGWFQEAYKDRMPVFYSSVDLRHSGHKLVPVDTNLFPAGFNNLNPVAFKRAVAAATDFLKRYYPEAGKILLIPENHTRNLPYLDNIAVLEALLKETGREVQLGSTAEEVQERTSLTSADGSLLALDPLTLKGSKLATKNGFNPDLIIINNDMTSGVPAILQHITQPIIPSVGLGWYVRRKSVHFSAYDQVIRSFSTAFGLDPFLLSTLSHHCGQVHFKEREGVECVALGVEKLLHSLRQKYAEHGIKDEPYVFIKADNGTYGMGIMTARSGEEVLEMNKKNRNKMDVIKEGVENTEVIIQEGVLTIDRVDEQVAEPMIYLVGGKPVGCIYRVNEFRDAYGNLNAKGMHFEKNVCGEQLDNGDGANDNAPCTFSVFGLIAGLASLAAAHEHYEVGTQTVPQVDMPARVGL